jgi:hypothetical protein
MKPVPCFEVNKRLEEAAREAEARKNRAIERLTEKLGIPGDHRRAARDLNDAGKHALKERGQ